jgi:hypothetical protein
MIEEFMTKKPTCLDIDLLCLNKKKGGRDGSRFWNARKRGWCGLIENSGEERKMLITIAVKRKKKKKDSPSMDHRKNWVMLIC